MTSEVRHAQLSAVFSSGTIVSTSTVRLSSQSTSPRRSLLAPRRSARHAQRSMRCSKSCRTLFITTLRRPRNAGLACSTTRFLRRPALVRVGSPRTRRATACLVNLRRRNGCHCFGCGLHNRRSFRKEGSLLNLRRHDDVGLRRTQTRHRSLLECSFLLFGAMMMVFALLVSHVVTSLLESIKQNESLVSCEYLSNPHSPLLNSLQ